MDKLRYHEIRRYNQLLRRKGHELCSVSGKLVRITFVKRPSERQFIQFIVFVYQENEKIGF